MISLAAALALYLPAQAVLPGTQPLTRTDDLAVAMVEGIHGFLDQATLDAPGKRAQYWKGPVEGNRASLRRMIGVVDNRVASPEVQFVATTDRPALRAKTAGFTAYAVRWTVLDGVTAEGLMLEPEGEVKARVVAVPDADQAPEAFARGMAGRLAANGCQVLIPTLIDRGDEFSEIPGHRKTNQPHREFLYRMAFEVGRHIIGYEVQKVLAAVDWFEGRNARSGRVPIGVAGYGEGGLIAFYSAAVDTRIERALVSGYFQNRQNLHREPIYRDVWGLLREFGDAEIAGLIAPRMLIVDPAPMPMVSGPPVETADRRGAAPLGRIETPELAEVEAELARARPFSHVKLAGGERGIEAFLGAKPRPAAEVPAIEPADLQGRRRRQFDELVAFTQKLVDRSPQRRAEFWAKADASSPERWKASTGPMRDHIWEEMIGRLPDPTMPANPRTRQIYDEPKFKGYEVMLDVWPGVFAYGILLVPKDVKPGEKRPVVVCQHGLEGRPQEVADPKVDSHYYHRYGVKLAEQGYVVFAPQNPYIGKDRFRQIQRKGHPLKLALFSFILGQHQRILEWLAGQPFVDARRIGFYGLSYGGKTAVRVPPLLDGYALSICSADFNEWVWKTTSPTARYSYLGTMEYDMVEFNLANIANYAELANLMAPRPFMVERGHDDGVSTDEWVAYEFAKVRRFYNKLGVGGRSEIEFFDGPHTIHGVGTFDFLRRHLKLGE